MRFAFDQIQPRFKLEKLTELGNFNRIGLSIEQICFFLSTVKCLEAPVLSCSPASIKGFLKRLNSVAREFCEALRSETVN
jgi:hypothetical protein